MATRHHQIVVQDSQARDGVSVAHHCLDYFVGRGVDEAQFVVLSACDQEAGPRYDLINLRRA